MTTETTPETTVSTNTQETSSSEVVSSTTADLEETKKTIMKAYFDKRDEEQGINKLLGLFSTNAYRNVAKKELLELSTEIAAPTTTPEGVQVDMNKIGEQVEDKIKDNVNKAVSAKIKDTPLNQFRYKYDEANMNKLKTVLSAISQSSSTELVALKEQIADGKVDLDATLTAGKVVLIGTTETTTTDKTETTDKTTETDQDTKIIPLFTTYKLLKAGDVVAEDEITYVNENAKSIIEDLETKWDLSEIKEIKDKDGNIVLKCRGETPYIHSKAAADLIGLALLYHKKTGQNILLESAYRTIAHQARLKKENAAKGTPTADPWYSWHNLWYSIDVSTATRYANKIGWIDGTKKLAKLFNFNPISSEDRHFDYKDFVDKYYDDREARLPEAQKLDKLFSDEQEPVSAAA